MMKASELETRLNKSKRKTSKNIAELMSNRTDTNPNFCWLLGAGASATSGISTAQQLVEEWRIQFLNENNAPDTLDTRDLDAVRQWLTTHEGDWYRADAEYGCFMEKKFSMARQRRLFIESQVDRKLPSIGYAYLVRLAESRFLRTVFTTNFDDLANEAFYQFSSTRPIVCAHDSSIEGIQLSSDRPKIIKLHGDYLFDELKVTQNETSCLRKNMEDKLHQFSKEYGLIVVGYGGGDRSILHPIERMLNDRLYLENGLYWCFRKEDVISAEVFNLLQKAKVFYVLIDGFDEFFADLYHALIGAETPFNSKIASDRAAVVIENYLTSPNLIESQSNVIREHLARLKAERDSSQIAQTLKTLQMDSENDDNDQIADADLLKLLEVEKCTRARDIVTAVNLAHEFKQVAASKKFQQVLLHKLFALCKLLDRKGEAKVAAEASLQLEPDNYLMVLAKCSILGEYRERIELLRAAIARNPCAYLLYNQLAREISAHLESDQRASCPCRPDDIEVNLNHSIQVNPLISNPGYLLLYNHVSQTPAGTRAAQKKLQDIVEYHLKQNPLSFHTSYLLHKHCSKVETQECNGRDYLDFIEDAFHRHYPKNKAEHFRILSSVYADRGEASKLRDLIRECDLDDDCRNNERFVSKKIQLRYDVFRDLDGAIRMGRKYLASRKSIEIETKLISLCLDAEEFTVARELLSNLHGAISQNSYYTLESSIYEHEGHYQDALDKISLVTSDPDVNDDVVSKKSYLCLKQSRWGSCIGICKKFLDLCAFDIRHESIIINYEFARLKDKGKISESRVRSLLASTFSKDVKAVCHAILGEKKEAVEICRAESEKAFSRVVSYLSWPALEAIKPELAAMKQDLASNRRKYGQ